MASYKALCLAGVVSLAATASAHAADLLPPPPPVEAPFLPQAPAIGGGWYLRGDVGAGALRLNNPDSTFSPTADQAGAYENGQPPGFAIDGNSIDEQVLAGVGAGYQFNSYFRADVTGEYRFSSRYQAIEVASGCQGYAGDAVECVDAYNGRLSNAVFLLNGYVDLGTWYRVTPYIGAGVGAALNTFSPVTDTSLVNTGNGTSSGNTHTGLAYAFMAGISYDLTPNVKLDMGYRYLDMGRANTGTIVCNTPNGSCSNENQHFHLVSNDIRLGLRYTFANFVPYAPQIPVIARY